MPVLDASVLVEYLAGAERAERVRDRILTISEPLWAPHLLDAEVGHVLRRAVRSGSLTAAGACAALRDLVDLPVVRASHRGLLPRAWELRDNLSFYDGLYVALAEQLRMSLLTFDARISGAPGVRATVELL